MLIAPEPAVADGYVRLGGLIVQPEGLRLDQKPLRAAEVGIRQVVEHVHPGGILRIRDHIPFRLTGLSRLVAAPAQVLLAEDNGIGCQRMDQFLPGQVVVLLAAFSFGMRTVEPDLRHGTVFGQQFEKLVQEVFVVIIHLEREGPLVRKRPTRHLARNGAQRGGASVTIQTVGRFHLVKIGRREVEAEFQAILAAGGRQFLHDIPPVGAGGYAVCRVAARPEDESVMVLGRQDHAFHPGVPEDPAPLVGIRLPEIEDGGVFDAAPPFHAREGIGAEMHEGGETVLQRMALLRRRDHAHGLVDHGLRRIVRLHPEGPGGLHRAGGGQQRRYNQGNLAHGTQK